MGALRAAGDDGLDPRDYATDLDSRRSAEADVRTTFAFLRYASDVRTGRTDPRTVDDHWVGKRRDGDLAKTLAAATDDRSVHDTLEKLPPRHGQYAALRGAMARYRKIAESGGWPQLPAKLALKRGSRSPEVALLRRRLAAEGDLPSQLATSVAVVPASMTSGSTAPAPGTSPAEVYDDAVVAAVKAFEERHGLAADGILDAKTIAQMNVPVGDRIRTLQLNLERWRWLPETLGSRYIFVNIPTFELRGFEGDTATIAMRVVTGKKDSPTPIFHDEMEAVVFSPYWNIPPRIMREETAPSIRRDPGYLYDNDLEVVRNGRVVDPWSVDWSNPGSGITVRQRPGRQNALGQVKFIFPNSFDVYLHDTPSESHFGRTSRAFSHGCVRVQDPQALAEWVLRDQASWTRDRIVQAMNAGQEKHVAVHPRIPVYLSYATAWVGGDGRVRFVEDIYGHDARQEQLLPRTPAASPAPPAVDGKKA